MQGHCHCGSVRWQSDGPVAWSCYCHCADCRRNCAAPVTAFFGVPHDSLQWVGDTPNVYNSSKGIERLFCGKCGTQMAYRNASDTANIHLYIATLDNPETQPPASHVFHAHHLPWLKIDDDLPRFDQGGG